MGDILKAINKVFGIGGKTGTTTVTERIVDESQVPDWAKQQYAARRAQTQSGAATSAKQSGGSSSSGQSGGASSQTQSGAVTGAKQSGGSAGQSGENTFSFNEQGYAKKLKDEGTGQRVSEHTLNRVRNEMESEFAFYNEAADRAKKAEELKQAGKKYSEDDLNAMTNWKKQHNAADWAGYEQQHLKNFEGADLMDYAWSYKVPQVVGTGLVGVKIADEVQTGPRTNASLYSNTI